jgi:hypothetical protein
MASQKESTLSIKSFRGVNRFSDGTVTPPNEFYTLQNFHPKSRGELKDIGGVVDRLNVAGFPGVEKIVSNRFFTDAYGSTKLLSFFIPEVTAAGLTPSVTSANFTGLPAGADDVEFLVTYVGPGGMVGSTRLSIGSLSASSIAAGDSFVFITPASIADYVAQIDVYVIHPDSGGTYCWCGSLHRVISSNTFPASGAFMSPIQVYISATTNSPKQDPSTARCHDGVLTGNTKKIFVGIAPHVAQVVAFDDLRHPRISLNDISGGILAVDIPDNGITSPEPQVEICFPFAPAGTAGAKQFDSVDLKAWIPFWGITPEDLLAANGVQDGASQPIIPETVQYTFFAGSSSADSVTLNNVSGYFQDGDRVLSNLTGVTGLTSGTVYYVRIISGLGRGGQTIVRFYASYADYVSDNYINITGFSSPAGSVYMSKLVFSVQYQPLNSRNGVQMVDDVQNKYDGPLAPNIDTWQAIASRTDGCFRNMMVSRLDFSSVETTASMWENGGSIISSADAIGNPSLDQALGCYVLDAFNDDGIMPRYQILPNINERSYVHSTLVQLNAAPSLMLAPAYFMLPSIRANTFDENDDSVGTTPFFQRILFANGDNQLMYSNGHVWKSAMPNDGTAPVPTGKYVSTVNGRVVSAGGRETTVNSPNNVYFSEIDSLFNWGAVINSFNVFSREPINGFGAFSQNLLDSSYTSFLIVSKRDSIFVWGGLEDAGAQQIHSDFGLAGPRAFSISDFGPILVCRDNVYTVQGDSIVQVGDEFADILSGLTDVQLQRVVATYHNKKVKISYPSGAGDDPESDREIWIEQRQEGGQITKYWSGPHALKPSYDQDRSISFSSQREVLASCYGDRIYQRASGTDNDGSNIDYKIVIDRLDLSSEQVWKLLQRIYVAVKVEKDEVFTITLDSEDGSAQYSEAENVTFANGSRQFAQWFVSERVRGRIVSVTLEISSNAAISIFNISLLFKILRRRTLRSGL